MAAEAVLQFFAGYGSDLSKPRSAHLRVRTDRAPHADPCATMGCSNGHRLVSALAKPARRCDFHRRCAGGGAVAGMAFGEPRIPGQRDPGCGRDAAPGAATDRARLLPSGPARAK